MAASSPATRAERRLAAVAGVRVSLPLALSVLPFGMVYGVTAARSDVEPAAGAAASVLLFAGASQLSFLELVGQGAPALVVIASVAVINARFALYSAALGPALAEFPRWWRYLLPHLMTDQVATLALARFAEDRDPTTRRWFFLGSGLLFATAWVLGTAAGMGAGAGLPSELGLGLAVPLTFATLLVATLTNRPAIVAAAVSATVTVAASGVAPAGGNILAGALAGLVAARVVR
ncbi:MAG: AzlC family ABC transporter permease [Actinomycetota bacterium]|nr:AzlC family ABC transporter permease [Actinomycetota bacterium]